MIPHARCTHRWYIPIYLDILQTCFSCLLLSWQSFFLLFFFFFRRNICKRNVLMPLFTSATRSVIRATEVSRFSKNSNVSMDARHAMICFFSFKHMDHLAQMLQYRLSVFHGSCDNYENLRDYVALFFFFFTNYSTFVALQTFDIIGVQ